MIENRKNWWTVFAEISKIKFQKLSNDNFCKIFIYVGYPEGYDTKSRHFYFWGLHIESRKEDYSEIENINNEEMIRKKDKKEQNWNNDIFAAVQEENEFPENDLESFAMLFSLFLIVDILVDN